MTLQRGDVVLVEFPNSDLVTYKLRPALVVQDLRIETGIPQVILVLITTQSLAHRAHSRPCDSVRRVRLKAAGSGLSTPGPRSELLPKLPQRPASGAQVVPEHGRWRGADGTIPIFSS